MTVWILALLLLGMVAAVGYHQGAIRGGLSLLGLVAAGLLAAPLAPLVRLAFRPLGVVNPLFVWAFALLVVFAVVLVSFKIAGLAVQQRASLYLKYYADDGRMRLWERLNQRLGLVCGLINGAIYLLLILMVVHPFSYLTVQVSDNAKEPWLLRLLNRAGHDLQATGLDRAVSALSPVPASFYQAADIGGLLYHNPLVQGRLGRYPALVGLSERPEFQAIANDKDYLALLRKRAPLAEVAGHENTKAVTRNAQLLRDIWALARPDLPDMSNFVATGESPKYDGEKILGRWVFDANGTIAAYKKTRPNLTTAQSLYYRQNIFPPLTNLTFIITPDKQVLVKNLARINFTVSPPQVSQPLNLQGQWTHHGTGGYQLILADAGKSETLQAIVEDERLTVIGQAAPLALKRKE